MKIPSETTLKKYGLSDLQYAKLWNEQGGLCPICGKELGDTDVVIDHDHKDCGKSDSKRFRNTPIEIRRRSVRGILHGYCNKWILGQIKFEQAKAIYKYLKAYEGGKTK